MIDYRIKELEDFLVAYTVAKKKGEDLPPISVINLPLGYRRMLRRVAGIKLSDYSSDNFIIEYSNDTPLAFLGIFDEEEFVKEILNKTEYLESRNIDLNSIEREGFESFLKKYNIRQYTKSITIHNIEILWIVFNYYKELYPKENEIILFYSVLAFFGYKPQIEWWDIFSNFYDSMDIPLDSLRLLEEIRDKFIEKYGKKSPLNF